MRTASELCVYSGIVSIGRNGCGTLDICGGRAGVYRHRGGGPGGCELAGGSAGGGRAGRITEQRMKDCGTGNIRIRSLFFIFGIWYDGIQAKDHILQNDRKRGRGY